ncbi:uncharacterized protein BDW43DRAFT_308023 [Aspergillus alliaceus]|uniref:uncharacterized protein n=1 Tax=Petromyces alliaceus TaxID=209559 RepID=UPI0012A472ED|nr:uncharacterized protein BDW43DRAFT_308023 [Aspergillus alliaceus]KAB8237011.1 hypothetical protein BDW43DRAFT_308023 [Aspergillus alliaceus]
MSSATAPQDVAAHLSANGLSGITWTGVAPGIAFIATRTAIRLRKMKRLLADGYFERTYNNNTIACDTFISNSSFVGLFWTVLWAIKGSFLALFWMISDGLPTHRRACSGIALFAFLANVSPLRLLQKAKINKHQKLGLAVVFCVGFIIIATAIVRAIEITGKSYSDQVGLAVWSIAESSISVIVGCLPPFKSFISKKSSTTPYLYASSYTGNRYDRSATSARKKRSLVATSWSKMPLPLKDMKSYREFEYEPHSRDVHITGGASGQERLQNTS